MDVIDQAQHQCELTILDRIRQARIRNRVHEESSAKCEECGKKIPEKRRKAVPGCRFCVPCQLDLENLSR
jgi:phage/conjugal plasmid C-4 type zinc finger TraR family protein